LILLLCVVPRFAYNVALAYLPKALAISSLSPYTAFVLAPDAEYYARGGGWQFWTSLAVSSTMGWVFLAWTAASLRQNWKKIEWTPPPKPIVWEPANEVEAQALAAQREQIRLKDPLCWAMSRLRMQNALIWAGALTLLLAGTGFAWALLAVGPTRGVAGLGIWSGLHLLLSLAAAGLLAWAAGRFFFEAQRSGELELLLSTPLGAVEIVGANWRALCQPLRGAWLLVAFLVMLQFIFGRELGLSGNIADPILVLLQNVLPVAWRVMDIIALCWLGMWFGLQARKPIWMMAWPAWLVVGLPWVVHYIFIIFLSLGSPVAGPGAAPSAGFGFLFIVWPLLNVIKDWVFISWAAGKLRAELRTKVSLAAGEWTK
jgi:hypothetical protein